MWETRSLRRNEATEVFVTLRIINGDFEGTLKLSHPFSHQMDVLDHEPVTLLRSVFESIHGDLLLTLTHRNVGEGLFVRALAVQHADTFDIGRGIYTREEHEERGGPRSHFVVDDLHVERGLLNEIFAKRLRHILSESAIETIRA